MRGTRSVAGLVSGLVVLGASLLGTPPASASSQTVGVNCASATPLTDVIPVGPGDTITFDVTSCLTFFDAYLTAVAYSPGLTAGHTNADGLAYIVGQIANLRGTNGTTEETVVLGTSASVVYTAGPREGTDTLVISNAMNGRKLTLPRRLLPRIPAVQTQAFAMRYTKVIPPTYYTLKLRGTETSQPQCWNTELTGLADTAIALPPSAQCTRVGSNVPAGSVLLGWATDPAFPIRIAQRHIDNGWGTFDGPVDGTRMIFIPAGQNAVLTGHNTLYAIWNK